MPLQHKKFILATIISTILLFIYLTDYLLYHNNLEKMSFTTPPTSELIKTLLNLESPVAQRMRCIFYLRTVGGEEATNALCEG